jgi:hypothetical protein
MSSLLVNSRFVRPMVMLGLLLSALSGRAFAGDGAALPSEEACTAAPVRSPLMARAIVAAAEHRYEQAGGAAKCFVENPTPEQLANIMAQFQALPPTMVNGLQPRYFTAGTVWAGNGAQGASGQGRAANLTYSFPADGVTWGDGANGPSAANDLRARLTNAASATPPGMGLGVGNEDKGLEIIRQALCSWRRFGGITYTEVADDNTAFSMATAHTTTRGDIRIGANAQGTASGVLAYNQFPTGGSDMTINSDWFPVAQGALGTAANNYRYFRDVVSHEHGHGLGFIHPVPCNSTKLMEPFIHTNTDGCLRDEFRGAGRNYGDRRSGNSSGAAATDWGNLTTPILKSMIERNLSTNGSTGANGSSADWFKFTIDSTQTVTITVTPTGDSPTGACCVATVCTLTTQGACTGIWSADLPCSTANICTNGACCNGTTCVVGTQASCTGTWVQSGTCNGTTCVPAVSTAACPAGTSNPWCQGQQSSGCTGTLTAVDAQRVGNLNIELRNGANGVTVLQTSAASGSGLAESLAAGALAPGTYWVRVFDSATTGNQTVQLYDLTLRVGTAKAPPVAVAGLHKRIQAGKNCYFFGDINSYTTDTGPTGGSNGMSYFWDLDGNGTFGGGIDSTLAQPVVTGGYPSNGVYPVTLRVTDSNGMTATDTINVVVFGATATISTVTPSSGDPGATVPVTITGVNLKGITSSTQFGVVGGGVTVTGTPVVNALGTQVTGLSFVVDASAVGSARDVTVSNSDGSNSASGTATGVAKFVVNGACSPPVILAQPQGQTLCAGASATLNVGATAGSGGPVTYQWRKGTSPINGATSSILQVPNISPASAGTYDCVVTNPCGSTPTDGAVLAVDTATITVQPVSQVACQGASATFTIGIQGTADLQWRKDTVNIPGATGASLVIDPVGTGDFGAYDCMVSNNCDVLFSDAVTLSAGGGVGVLAQPASQSVCEGASISLTFGVNGATSFQWRKGMSDIPQATSSTLSLSPATLADAGDYVCVATGPCGSTPSNAATVGVCSAVAITQEPSARSVCRGGSATFTVAATGSALAYQWRKGGTPIVDAVGPSLTVSPVGAPSVGSYDCVVGNCCQQTTSSAAALTVCVADYNCSGGVSVDDIFDYLNGWFAGAPAADVNGVDGLTVQDIFDFINAWLAGC